MAIENIRFQIYFFVLFELKHTEFFTSHGGYDVLNTTLKVPGVGFSAAGLDRAKFGIIDFKGFFVYCCHGDIDFTKNYILTHFNS